VIYVKSFLAGIASALVACVIMICAAVVVPIVRSMSSAGSGGIGAVTVSISGVALVVGALVAFTAGFYWQFRRGVGGVRL
jgi:thiamine transporter ThiT